MAHCMFAAASSRARATFRIASCALLASSVTALGGCSSSVGEADESLEEDSRSESALVGDVKTTYRFDALTPTGERIFRNALLWMEQQERYPSFPRRAQCANNVSHVLEKAGITRYSSPLVEGMLDNVRRAGGRVVLLPKAREPMLAALRTINGGKLPVGTLVGGCLRADCEGESGDGHISMVGDTANVDADERVLRLYHNNWYRPDNNGGVWVPNMVSKRFYYELGFERQWMPTPWLRLTEDASGRLSNVVSELPAIDDLDPFQYFVFVAVLPEVQAELDAGLGVRTDGRGGVAPLDEPGEIECPAGYEKRAVGSAGGVLCTDGVNAWGPFTRAMIDKCLAWGGGETACRSDRWSLALAEAARGTGLCPAGARFDRATRYCVEGDDAFGPFPAPLVQRCVAFGGGSACRSSRWNRGFLAGLLR